MTTTLVSQTDEEHGNFHLTHTIKISGSFGRPFSPEAAKRQLEAEVNHVKSHRLGIAANVHFDKDTGGKSADVHIGIFDCRNRPAGDR